VSAASSTGYLLKHVPEARGDANICGDVGSPMVVRFGEKGLMWIKIEAHGVAAHGAHVHKGVNAIDRLRAALDRVKELERLPVAAPEAVVRAIEAARPISERLSGAGESDTLRRITINLGTISGGISPNLVPTHAVAQADVRLPVGISTAELEAKRQRASNSCEHPVARAMSAARVPCSRRTRPSCSESAFVRMWRSACSRCAPCYRWQSLP